MTVYLGCSVCSRGDTPFPPSLRVNSSQQYERCLLFIMFGYDLFWFRTLTTTEQCLLILSFKGHTFFISFHIIWNMSDMLSRIYSDIYIHCYVFWKIFNCKLKGFVGTILLVFIYTSTHSKYLGPPTSFINNIIYIIF